MVSALWKACDEGDTQRVLELLKESSSVDIEVKDHTGATPLVQAVKGYHWEIVQALLAHGADPFNASSQGPPEAHTNDPLILQTLDDARRKALSQTMQPSTYPPPETYGATPGGDPTKYSGFIPHPYYLQGPYGPYAYMPPPPNGPPGVAAYPYYASAMPPPPPSHEQQQQMLPQQQGYPSPTGAMNDTGNLPPVDVAKTIPCRYYPACKYGAACHFAHPQAPYNPGPLPPPAHYGTSAQDVTSFQPSYYPMTPYPHPPTMSPTHPGPPPPQQLPEHSRSPSEITSPASGTYTPQQPPQGAYPMPMSPYANGMPYPIPVAMAPPPHPHNGYVPSPHVGYTPTSPMAPGPPYHARRESVGAYSQGMVSPLHALDPTHIAKSPPMNSDVDLYSPRTYANEPPPRRNQGGRRPQYQGNYNSKRQPCLFFPTGRCRNGDGCKFPHVPSTENGGSVPAGNRPNGHRPRPSNGGFTPIDERMADLRIRDNNNSPKSPAVNGLHQNGDASAGSPVVNGVHHAPRYAAGKQSSTVNGSRVDKRNGTNASRQRVPTPDDFPVLGGNKPSASHPQNHVIGFGGLTAAQVLQAPAPKREGNGHPLVKSENSLPNGHSNGDVESNGNGSISPISPTSPEQLQTDLVVP